MGMENWRYSYKCGTCEQRGEVIAPVNDDVGTTMKCKMCYMNDSTSGVMKIVGYSPVMIALVINERSADGGRSE